MNINNQNVAGAAAAAPPNQGVVAPPNAVAPVNGGVTATGTIWTGGPADPALRALPRNQTPRSPLCCRSETTNRHVWNRCEKGVDEEWTIKMNNTTPLATCEPVIHGDLKNVGVDSVFWMNHAGRWGDLFLHPDAVSLAQIRAHEEALSVACPYDRENMLYSRKFLENSVDQALRRKIAPSLRPEDGGPAFWSLIKCALHGAETAKLVRHQAVIKETKLVNFPGYDVSKYHEVLIPSLTACNEANQLPLNVGPKVITNHMGPKNLGYNSLVQIFAGEQAQLHDTQNQYNRLVDQIDSLRDISLNNEDEWEKVEGQKGAYSAQLRQTDMSQVTCYGCGQQGHIKKNCPGKKKSGKNGGSSTEKNEGQLKKKWYNSNPDNKTTMERNGKTYHWCPICKYGRGTWTDHTGDDCPHKDKKKGPSKSSNANSGDGDVGLLVMELIEGAFVAVDIL